MTHEHGFLKTECGSITSMDGTKLYDNVAIIVDLSDGCFHKVGEPDWVKNHYNLMVERFSQIDPSYAEKLTYIEFNPKTGDTNLDEYLHAELSKDEICTLVNYFSNCIGEKRMNQIMTMDADALHAELAKLNATGW